LLLFSVEIAGTHEQTTVIKSFLNLDCWDAIRIYIWQLLSTGFDYPIARFVFLAFSFSHHNRYSLSDSFEFHIFKSALCALLSHPISLTVFSSLLFFFFFFCVVCCFVIDSTNL
jgi:hypothetical protein